jgi:protocatechuate 3,4-dioxygenase beta subunit
MNNKDSVFTRRRFIRSSVGVAATLKLQRAAQAYGIATQKGVCKLSARQEVGPYYIPGELLRSNIVEGRAGVPLSLRIVLLDSRTCTPVPGAAVDLWHCDAVGLYSGFTKQNPMGPPPGAGGGPPGPPPFGSDAFAGGPGGPGPMGPPPNHAPTDKLTFLRGIQLTDSAGSVRFSTVFPGFYMGRTNHIHFKARLGGHASGKSYEAGHTSYIGQIFFPEGVTAELMQQDPYRRHQIHRTTQSEDRVFGEQDGELSIAQLRILNPGHPTAGLAAEIVTTIDPSTTADDRFGPRPGPGFGPGPGFPR